ncbi:hypothetical protein DERP_008423 [Dermatophagoides pteronyssinus]|uniref:Uncharacterized protein n=1 Tax=Dermatophagoides pteronyssinus TaxID=6956 RepID=A0ABQ8IV83_DERPT|nr:hypothetical protein DERP_008423 [Dermatophagoides pteronyssinus]
MFFEFESSSSSNQPTKDSSLAQNSIIMAKKISSISPLAIDSSNSFLNHHISPFSSSLSSSSTPTRHRRYSMHSFVSTTGQNQQQQSNALGTLRENIPASSNCDLALITKKKLMILTANGGSTSISTNSPFSLSSSSSSSSGILNGSLSNKLKSADEGFIEPDVKLNQTFTKRSNSDLRKEVLLASIQRSLSASSEDLFAINKTLNQESSSSSMNTDSLNDDDPMDQSMNTVSQSITIPMLIQNNQNNNSSSRYGSSSAIYMPSETQINQRSPTTFTSTLSMAGSIRNNHQSSPSSRKVN